jgi:hypothetical protein
MAGGYSTVYLRKTFSVTNPGSITTLIFEGQFDDGIKVWINGTYVLGSNVPATNPVGDPLARTATATSALEPSGFVPFEIPSNVLVSGTNVIAVQLVNYALSDVDAVFDGRLVGYTSGSSGATPGGQNTGVYAANAPPQVRQVDHSPNTPIPGQAVTVTAKVTDPNGVGTVTLKYQLVNPGDYINLTDSRYATQWTSQTMYDDGTNGDAFAGDGEYTAVIAAANQTNRRLVRYRITAADTLGASITAPYSDDPQPNFAYYVYAGEPSWTGSARPGVQPNVVYPSTLMDSVPVYQLLTTAAAHQDSQHIPSSSQAGYTGEDYLWLGTLVYDGEVYDHIRFRAGGDQWRYAMGKNQWKIDFNRGHEFQASDNDGNNYATTWDKLTLGAVIQQGDDGLRGEQGQVESEANQLYNLAGVAAPHTS